MKTLHLSIIAILIIGMGVAYAYSSAGFPETHYPPTNDTKLELLVMNSTEFKEITTGYNHTLAGIDYNWIPKANNYYDLGGARVTFIVCCFANGTVKGVAFNLDPQLKIKNIFEYNADNPPSGYYSDTCHGCFLGALNSTKPIVEPKNVIEPTLKQLVNAKDAISNMMGSKMLKIPISVVGVDEQNLILDVGINDPNAVIPSIAKEYQKKVQEIVGNLPIQIDYENPVAYGEILKQNNISPPIVITQVELWGPISFYADGVKLCGYNDTSLGPWAIGWIELYNTKNETMMINDVDIRDAGGEEGYTPITLGPHEYCYVPTQDRFTTRIGVGGSLGNGSPIHDNATVTLVYSIQPFAGKMLYNYSTPKLSDDFGDTRTWQLVDGNWIFKEANIKHEFPVKTTLLSPSKQIQSGIAVKDLACKEGLVVIIKKSDPTNWYLQDIPSCVTPSSASKLTERGWGIPEQTIPIQNTNSTVTYYVEGSKLDQIIPDLSTHGLTLSLETTSDSKMTLFIPRSFIDSTTIGDYASFNVTANGNKINYDEHLTPTDRMLTILFPNGTKNIQIIPRPFTENQG